MSNERLRPGKPAPRLEASISLGGNIGDVAETFRFALRRLDEHPQIELTCWSGLYESEPMGKDAGDAFLNAAALLETTLAPHPLLDVLQSIEAEGHRTRGIRWGPRTLDLDLILFGEQTISAERLSVPHPDYWYRRFVLHPLAEIAPDMRQPSGNWSVESLLERISASSLTLEVTGTETSLAEAFVRGTEQRFPGVRILQRELDQRELDQRDFDQRDFDQRDFDQRDFDQRDFDQRDFDQRDFDQRDFDGKDRTMTVDFSLSRKIPQGSQQSHAVSDYPQHIPPFHIASAGFEPNQRILDILSAARGQVSRVAAIELP